MSVVTPELQCRLQGDKAGGVYGGKKAQKKTPEWPYLASTLANKIIPTVKLKPVVAEQRESQRFYDPTARNEF